MKIYSYPVRALTGDYLRAVAGLGVSVAVLVAQPDNLIVIVIFGAAAALFGFFGFRTVQRHLTKVAITDEELCNAGFVSRIMKWTDLERLKLRYYGTRRQEQGSGGFMQLTLRGGGLSLTYDSGMEGFDYVAWRAAKAARENGFSVDPAWAVNLLALGVDADGEMPPPGT